MHLLSNFTNVKVSKTLIRRKYFRLINISGSFENYSILNIKNTQAASVTKM